MTEPSERATDGAPFVVTGSTEQFHGAVFSVRTDMVAMPDGRTARRDYVRHRGAVCVVAVDEQERVVLVRQYRHPVGEVLWELPAGLLDVDGEDHATAAARELAEEASLVAARWDPLITIYTSPGYSDERIEIFLARQLSPVDDGYTFERVLEEAHMTVHEVPLADAVAMVDRGEIVNGVCAVGLLAAWYRLRTAPASDLPSA